MDTLVILFFGNIVLSIIAAIGSSSSRLGIGATFLISFLFSAPVGVICSFISGEKKDLSTFEQAVVDRLDELIKLQKEKAVLEESNVSA